MKVDATPRRRHPVRRAFLGLLASLTILAMMGVLGLFYLEHRLNSQIGRIDGVFDGLEHRPPVIAAQAVNILLVGTDPRSSVEATDLSAADPPWLPGVQRIASVMVVHLDGDRRGASVVSLPRDSWVSVPGHGMDTLGAALSSADPALAVHAVEDLTGVRIDHLAVMDWEGFRELTNAVGGVPVDVTRTVFDSARSITWAAGRHLLDGQSALDYVGQRNGLPNGDLDSVRRQQYFLRALMEESLRTQMRRSPRIVYDFLDIVTRNLSVDDGWGVNDMGGLVLSVRNLRTADIRYLTVPVRGQEHNGDQSVVYLDHIGSSALWLAVRLDQVDGWVSRHPGVATDAEVP